MTAMGVRSPALEYPGDGGSYRADAAPRVRLRAAAARALPTLAAFAALRIAGVLSYAGLVAVRGRYAHRPMFTAVDGGWYRLIAVHGYDLRASAPYHGSVFGFFPLYPALMHAGAAVTGLGVDAVGLAVTWAAALAVAWALYETGLLLHSARTGTALALLWAVAPASIAESMLYADTLAIALSAWALYALLRRWWTAAALLAALAGMTRPTAAAAGFAVCAAAAVALVRREDGWRPAAALLVAPLGTAAFLGYVAARTGGLTGYFAAQRTGWDSHFDGGISTLHRIHEGLAGAPGYLSAAAVISTGVLVAAPILIAVQIYQRQPWQLVAYTVAVSCCVYGVVHLYTTSPRELLALYPLLLPAARRLGRIENRVALVVLFAALAVASGWYAGYVPVQTGVIP